MNNYHLLMAFITGLNNSAIQRLKWTEKKLSSKYRTVTKKQNKKK